MSKILRQSVVSLLLLTLVTGVVYPLVVTALAQLFFPTAANGSVILHDGKPVGSALIGQPFSDPRYFWGRPSATAPFPYNGAASGGSNLGPTNPALADAVKRRIAALRAADPENTKPVPVDLVTASGSGLDPQISPAAVEFQVERVARARGMNVEDVRKLVAAATEKRQWRIFGEPRVNVLQLNLALDGK
ncbi:MAG TPA: potassium-transporting ATPase subunit KdpC [Rhodanobacteraceae bacterium]|nr:potassium-transporting ATPase subunit KdpC [Rhodanobacteraceae bacterium]